MVVVGRRLYHLDQIISYCFSTVIEPIPTKVS